MWFCIAGFVALERHVLILSGNLTVFDEEAQVVKAPIYNFVSSMLFNLVFYTSLV